MGDFSESSRQADLEVLERQLARPARAVVTAGMPYANGPVHLGHLAGAHVPADIHARWLKMLIGPDNVLFVCGSDDHGSASELAAMEAGRTLRAFIDEIHEGQCRTLERYAIGLDIYSGTSRPDCFPVHQEVVHDFIRRLHRNGMFERRVTLQWFDPALQRFLQDRFVRGHCPNPKCDNDSAYSDECDRCGARYQPAELIDPRSALSDSVPVLRETLHWWLDMSKVADVLAGWVRSKEGTWRTPVYNEVINTVLPALRFPKTHESVYKDIKTALPPHKSKYAPGKQILLQFDDREALTAALTQLQAARVPAVVADEWAHRAVTRDVAWGMPLPPDLDPDMRGKTLYVWPESLIAPISFTKVALAQKGSDPALYEAYWKSPDAGIYQFLGQDNVFFYTLMQGALWLGTQDEPQRLPRPGEYQLTDVFGCFHLKVDGEKMSKSRGNFLTGDRLLDMGYTADQIRYFVALLNLPEKPANFDLAMLDERNRFLAGPINSAFERPISACHSKFGGRVPDGVLFDKVAADTVAIVRRYVRSMARAEYSTLLYAIETYARVVNSLFTQYKPHDDRFPERGRRDALFSSFYALKTLMIMLYPIVPDAMNRVRESLRLDPAVFRVEELGTPIPAGHAIGQKQQFFPAAPETRVHARHE